MKRSSQRPKSRSPVGGGTSHPKHSVPIAALLFVPPLVGAVGLLFCLLVSTFMLNGADDPESYSDIAVLLSCALSGGLCGLFACRLAGKPFPWNLVSVCFLLCAEWVLVFLLDPVFDSPHSIRIPALLCYIGGAIVFSLLGKPKENGRRKNHPDSFHT